MKKSEIEERELKTEIENRHLEIHFEALDEQRKRKLNALAKLRSMHPKKALIIFSEILKRPEGF